MEVRRHDHRDRLVRLHVRLDLRARRCRGRERVPRHRRAAEPPEPESQRVAGGAGAGGGGGGVFSAAMSGARSSSVDQRKILMLTGLPG